GFREPLYPDIIAMINAQDIEHIIPTTPPRGTEPPVGSPIISSPSSSVGSSSPVRMAPKRKSTSVVSTMTQAAIKKLVVDSVVAALEAQAATTVNADNTNRNTKEGETPVARKCSYKEFMSCQPSYFKGTEGVVGLICWFERTELWNSFAQPIRIEEAYKTTWSKLKKLLTKKYCPRTEVKKIEDEFYSLTVKGNDLKTYVRRFQELAVLCLTMVPNSEKLMEFDDRRTFTTNNNNNYHNNRNNNNNNRNNDHHQQLNKRQEAVRAYAATPTKDSRVGYQIRNCKNKGPATGSNLQPVSVTSHACGEKGHSKNQ
ncbi:reverse transcriptase domain-containing protein, partial [Tanacetum coccineum]